jgi:NAD(P)H dehydrogenase (quinone)
MDRILITAATGRTGKATAKLLLERGLSVRALVRKEDERSEELVRLGAEIVTGDLRNFSSLRAAMKDVSRAYFVFPISPGLYRVHTVLSQDAGIGAIHTITHDLNKESSQYPSFATSET